jgi:hypothetical protein
VIPFWGSGYSWIEFFGAVLAAFLGAAGAIGPDGAHRLVIIPRNAGETGSTGVSEVRRCRSRHSEEPEVGIGLRG